MDRNLLFLLYAEGPLSWDLLLAFDINHAIRSSRFRVSVRQRIIHQATRACAFTPVHQHPAGIALHSTYNDQSCLATSPTFSPRSFDTSAPNGAGLPSALVHVENRSGPCVDLGIASSQICVNAKGIPRQEATDACNYPQCVRFCSNEKSEAEQDTHAVPPGRPRRYARCVAPACDAMDVLRTRGRRAAGPLIHTWRCMPRSAN
jgi:hypothetical protein